MRIKKKEILEAVEKYDPNKVKADLEAANRFITQDAKEFSDNVKNAFGNTDKAKQVADDLTLTIVEPKKQSLEEEGADSVHTKKFDSCVKKVKANSDVDNPYAVCQDSLGKDAIKKSHRRTVKEVIKIKDLKK